MQGEAHIRFQEPQREVEENEERACCQETKKLNERDNNKSNMSLSFCKKITQMFSVI